MRRTISILVLTISIALTLELYAQNDGRIHVPPSVRWGQDTRNIPVRTSDQIDAEQARKLYAMRQAEIREDTQKLVQLSNELKQYTDGTSDRVLSLDMIKKAEAIEKLAHNVKQRMKQNR